MLQIVDIISIITCTIQFSLHYQNSCTVRLPSDVYSITPARFVEDENFGLTPLRIRHHSKFPAQTKSFPGNILGYKHFFKIHTRAWILLLFILQLREDVSKKVFFRLVNQITPQTSFKYQSGDGFYKGNWTIILVAVDTLHCVVTEPRRSRVKFCYP